MKFYRKKWIDEIKKNLEALKVVDWKERTQDHDDWRMVSVVAKILTEILIPKSRRKNNYYISYFINSILSHHNHP